MELGSPFDALHGAIASAIHNDLPDIDYWQQDWIAYNSLTKEEKLKLRVNEGSGKMVQRRPESYEIEVVMFPQTWGSTALGYGGIGGASMTPAYTVIVSHRRCSCVYFGGGRLAYRVDGAKQSPEGQKRFIEDISRQNMAARSEATRYD